MNTPHTDHVNHVVMLIPIAMLVVAVLMFLPLFNWPGDQSIIGVPVKVVALSFAIFFTPLIVLGQMQIHMNVDFDDEIPHG